MKRKYSSALLLVALLLSTALPAAGDFLIIWTAEDFTLKAGSSYVPLCVGDMVGNGSNVIVGRIGGIVTQIRDAMTGVVIHQFPAYVALGSSYTMVDIDGDGSMECIVTNASETSVIDWVIASSSGDGGFGGQAEIDFTLHPNPARPGTTAAFTLAEDGDVEISIYDVTGRRVRQLVNEARARGPQEIRWDGRDAAGIRMASGTYFFELRLDGRQVASRKSVLLR